MARALLPQQKFAYPRLRCCISAATEVPLIRRLTPNSIRPSSRISRVSTRGIVRSLESRVPIRAIGWHKPGLPLRPQHAQGRGRGGQRRPHHSSKKICTTNQRDNQQAVRRYNCWHPLMPRYLPQSIVRIRRLRARSRSALQGTECWCQLPRVRQLISARHAVKSGLLTSIAVVVDQ